MVHAGFLDGHGTAQGLPRRSQILPGLRETAFSVGARCRAVHYRESAGGQQREGGGRIFDRGPDVVVGPGCVIEPGVRLSSCTLMKGVRVKSSAHVSGSIIGWHSTIGGSAQVSRMTVLGKDVHVKETVFLDGVSVLPEAGDRRGNKTSGR